MREVLLPPEELEVKELGNEIRNRELRIERPVRSIDDLSQIVRENEEDEE